MIPTPHSILELGQGTHPGETGKNNEDSYAITSYYAIGGEIVTLAIIADGVGGNTAGEVASALAVKTATEFVGRSFTEDYAQILANGIREAAQAVHHESTTKAEYKGMGTTLVVAMTVGHKLYTSYIGDSRLYVYNARANRLFQASVDHTFVQEAIEMGLITAQEAKTHPHRHVIRRHIGADPSVQPDLRLRLSEKESKEKSEHNQGLPLQPGDMVLLCSDGLSDLVEADEIKKSLTTRTPQAAVNDLIWLARRRGGHDNITVLVLKVPQK
jgi:protein phosphatase